MARQPEYEQPFIAQHDMIWERAPQQWLDGVPLANGHVGALIWGDGHPLRITLDKYDCWELRELPTDAEKYNYQTLRRLVEQAEAEQIWQIFGPIAKDSQLPYPTRLPMPRLEIDFGPECKDFTARLSLYTGTVCGQISLLSASISWRAYVHAARNLVVIEFNDMPEEFSLSVKVGLDHLNDEAKKTLKSWGYGPAQTGEQEGVDWLRLEFPAGGEYVVAWRQERRGQSGRLLLTILTHNDDPNPLAAALDLLQQTASADPHELRTEHVNWWGQFWEASVLTIPDHRLAALYYAEMYKLGCSTRPNGLPISLQGLWTLDGAMPPWSGDYHLDMNVQESYWPVYTSNHLDLGHSLYEAFFKVLPLFQRRCKEFFGFEGAWCGCALAYNGARVSGYATAEFWPGNGAWLCHMYWLHWLYSGDKEFLRHRAYPMLSAFMRTYLNLLEEGPDGKLHLPLSNSPEWEEGEYAAWGQDTTCDLALTRWLAAALLATTELLCVDEPEAARWHAVLERLVDYPKDGTGLLVKADTPLSHSHRHHSHLMAIHPLGILTVEDDPEAQELISRSLSHWQQQGMGEWTGWSFPWASLIASRCGLGNMAWQMLDIYANAFVCANTFHINGDPRQFGICQARYQPMTLEGGFCTAAAIMEMLLQSWGGKIRLFPAIPERWHEAYFADLRTEGAFLVTSQLRDDEVVFVEIVSEQGSDCRLVSPWPEQITILVDLADGSTTALSGSLLEFHTEAGRRYRLHPEGYPPNHEDLYFRLPQYDEGSKYFFGLKRLSRF